MAKPTVTNPRERKLRPVAYAKADKAIKKRELTDLEDDEAAKMIYDHQKLTQSPADDEREEIIEQSEQDNQEHDETDALAPETDCEGENGPGPEEICEEETGVFKSWLVKGILIGLLIPLAILLLQCCLHFYEKKKNPRNSTSGPKQEKNKPTEKKKEKPVAKKKSSIKVKSAATDVASHTSIKVQGSKLSCVCQKKTNCWKTCPGSNKGSKSYVNFAPMKASASTSFHSDDFQKLLNDDDEDKTTIPNNGSISVLSAPFITADAKVGTNISFKKERLSVGVGTETPGANKPRSDDSCKVCTSKEKHTHDYKFTLKRGISNAGNFDEDSVGECSFCTTSVSSDGSLDDHTTRLDESFFRCREILNNALQPRIHKPISALRKTLYGKKRKQLRRPEDLPLLSYRSDE